MTISFGGLERRARRRQQRADIVGCAGVVGMWAVITGLLIVGAYVIAVLVLLDVVFVAACQLIPDRDRGTDQRRTHGAHQAAPLAGPAHGPIPQPATGRGTHGGLRAPVTP